MTCRRMFSNLLTITVVAGCLAGWAVESVEAQGRRRTVPRYSPPSGRPTVSPYLNLFRNNFNNPLPNYQTFVRPMQEQQRANQEFSRQFRRQSMQINRLQTDQQLLQRQTQAAPTGIGATFFNYSHFYPRR